MLAPYREILNRSGAWRFSLAGALARSPMAMVGIGIVLMVQTTYGSYALAGWVSAAYMVASSVTSPALAALVDQFGQSRVMRPALALSAAGLAGLTLVGVLHPPAGWALAAAVVTGAGMGSYGSMVRARWSALLANEPGPLHTAYSLESVLDEVVYIFGPAVTTMLSTGPHPSGGLATALVLAVGGGIWFLTQRRSEPNPAGKAPHGASALRSPGMAILAFSFIAVGALFGATDVATVAFATELGQRELAGPVLAAFGFGSMVAGLLYGTRHWKTPAPPRFALAGVGLAIGTTPFLLAETLGWLAIAMLIAGAAISPMLISGNSIVVQLVPSEQLTEGLTWIGTSLGIGVSIGSALAGPVIDHYGSQGGFVVAVGSAAAVAATVAVAAPVTTRHLIQDSDQT